MHNARSVTTIDPSTMYLPQSEILKRTTLKNVYNKLLIISNLKLMYDSISIHYILKWH